MYGRVSTLLPRQITPTSTPFSAEEIAPDCGEGHTHVLLGFPLGPLCELLAKSAHEGQRSTLAVVQASVADADDLEAYLKARKYLWERHGRLRGLGRRRWQRSERYLGCRYLREFDREIRNHVGSQQIILTMTSVIPAMTHFCAIDRAAHRRGLERIQLLRPNGENGEFLRAANRNRWSRPQTSRLEAT